MGAQAKIEGLRLRVMPNVATDCAVPLPKQLKIFELRGGSGMGAPSKNGGLRIWNLLVKGRLRLGCPSKN